MANKVLVQEMDGTPKQIVFADHATNFSPTAANDLRKTTDGTHELDVEMNVGALANLAYWQSAKFDFGENRALSYAVRMVTKLAATPTAGNTIDIWLSPSQSATAGTANAGGASGANATYTGYSSNAAASVKQLQELPSGVVTTQTTMQIIECGRFSPTERYGSLVLLNGAGSAFTDDIEFHVVFDPQVDEVQ